MVQGAKDTGDSGCEVHDGRVGEESIGGVQLSHGARIPRRCTKTPTTLRASLSTLCLCKKKSTVQAVRQITLVHDICSFSFKMKRRSSWLTRVKSAVAVGLLLLGGEGVPCCLPRRYLSACASMSYNPVEKVSGALRDLSPAEAFAFIQFTYCFSAYALQKTKLNDTPLEENKRTSTKRLCRSSSQHIH